MPYVTPERRAALLAHPPAMMQAPGDLAFLVAQAVADYVRQRGVSWQTISDVSGALDGVGREFWSEVGQPYEDDKRRRNGDIF